MAVSVTLPLPAIGMSVGANALAISWPGWANDWGLYTTTNLAPPVVWIAVTNATSSNAGVFNVTLPVGAGSQYFRLIAP